MDRRSAGMSPVRSVGMNLDKSAILSKFHTGIMKKRKNVIQLKPICRPVPVSKCKDVQEAVTSVVPSTKCYSKPKEVCKKVPKQHCEDVSKQDCKDVPRQKCNHVPKEHCHTEYKDECTTHYKQITKYDSKEECKTVQEKVERKVSREVCH